MDKNMYSVRLPKKYMEQFSQDTLETVFPPMTLSTRVHFYSSGKTMLHFNDQKDIKHTTIKYKGRYLTIPSATKF